MIVNLFDEAFRHLPISVLGKRSKHIQYVRDARVWDGVTIFTDLYLCTPVASQVRCKYKIGWLLESRDLIPHIYDELPRWITQYDFVITHDEQLLRDYPNKTRKSIFGGCWVEEDSYGIHPKTKDMSMVYSDKTQLTGHRLRHAIASEDIPNLSLFGRGSANPIEKKEEALIDYRYSIVIENTKQPNYFTEKLLDCFATGTIPVYYGCPNIKDYFNTEGIITFDSKEELLELLPTLTAETYESKRKAIRENFKIFPYYAVTEDWLYSNILKDYEA